MLFCINGRISYTNIICMLTEWKHILEGYEREKVDNPRWNNFANSSISFCDLFRSYMMVNNSYYGIPIQKIYKDYDTLVQRHIDRKFTIEETVNELDHTIKFIHILPEIVVNPSCSSVSLGIKNLLHNMYDIQCEIYHNLSGIDCRAESFVRAVKVEFEQSKKKPSEEQRGLFSRLFK